VLSAVGELDGDIAEHPARAKISGKANIVFIAVSPV
jgi:hypothetical protein